MDRLNDRTVCESVRPELMNYLLEETSGEQRVAIRRHLESCAACAEEALGLRATLGVVQQGGELQPVPQHFRIVGEPTNWGLAFWRSSSRLAFAASALACVSIALLALSRTNVSYRQGDFDIAFGAPAQPAVVAERSPQPAVIPAASDSQMKRSEVMRLISDAIATSEARQRTSATQMVNAVSTRADAQRRSDWLDMAESFRSFQAAQVTMWKQQVQSQQYVGALMRNAGMELPAAR